MSLKSWPSCLLGTLSHIYLELSELTRLARQPAPGSTCLLPMLWAMVPFFPLFLPSFLSVFPSYFLPWLLRISRCLQGKHFTSWLTPMNLTIYFLWLLPRFCTMHQSHRHVRQGWISQTQRWAMDARHKTFKNGHNHLLGVRAWVFCEQGRR